MSIRPRLLVSSSSPYEEDPRPDLAPVHDTQNQGHRKEFAFEVNAFDAILNGEVEKMEQMKSLIEDIKDMRKLDPSAGDNESPDQRERIDRLLDNAIDAANKIEEMAQLGQYFFDYQRRKYRHFTSIYFLSVPGWPFSHSL